ELVLESRAQVIKGSVAPLQRTPLVLGFVEIDPIALQIDVVETCDHPVVRIETVSDVGAQIVLLVAEYFRGARRTAAQQVGRTGRGKGDRGRAVVLFEPVPVD